MEIKESGVGLKINITIKNHTVMFGSHIRFSFAGLIHNDSYKFLCLLKCDLIWLSGL